MVETTTRLAFRSPLCLKNDPMISVPDFLVDLLRNFEDRLYRTRAHVRLLPLKTIKQSRLRLTWPQTWAPVSSVVPYGLLALRAILHKLSGIIINMDVFEFDHMCRHTVQTVLYRFPQQSQARFPKSRLQTSDK